MFLLAISLKIVAGKYSEKNNDSDDNTKNIKLSLQN